MQVTVVEAKDQLSRLLRAVEDGEQVVITRNGRAVAQLCPPPRPKSKIILGGMKDKIRLLPGWDDPMDENEFLGD